MKKELFIKGMIKDKFILSLAALALTVTLGGCKNDSHNEVQTSEVEIVKKALKNKEDKIKVEKTKVDGKEKVVGMEKKNEEIAVGEQYVQENKFEQEDYSEPQEKEISVEVVENKKEDIKKETDEVKEVYEDQKVDDSVDDTTVDTKEVSKFEEVIVSELTENEAIGIALSNVNIDGAYALQPSLVDGSYVVEVRLDNPDKTVGSMINVYSINKTTGSFTTMF